MIDRIVLKNKAKEAFSKCYWWAVLVAFILMLVGGSSSVSINSDDTRNLKQIIEQNSDSTRNPVVGSNDIDDFFSEYGYDFDSFTVYNDDYYSDDYEIEYDEDMVEIIIFIVLIAVFIGLAIGLALSLFVLVPFQIGCKRWFVLNKTEQRPSMGELVVVFKKGYINAILITFLQGLYIFLWTLLFIIPGIIKSFEYRLIPYILAENPQISRKEAFRLSKEIMHGHKWESFVLDLSFLGWNILSAITLGIVGIFWSNPYKEATYAEYYIALCQNHHHCRAGERMDTTGWMQQ